MPKNPLFTRAAIVTLVAFVATVLAHFGVVVPEDVKTGLVEVIALVGPGLVAYWAHKHQQAPQQDESQPDESEQQ